ncbi:MAG: isoprenylcysteine carboxylmethyltransferase family protein [Deltaproteobacteria bacterium]|nr:isoprenylcysteine carboxylmethyltransferase family protein [Deltaproteobacteria bacterium]
MLVKTDLPGYNSSAFPTGGPVCLPMTNRAAAGRGGTGFRHIIRRENTSMLAISVFAFMIISGVIITVSRNSLKDPLCHGFYRFFAFEFLLLLVILNIPSWFDDPFSWNQTVSWPLLIGSLMLIIHSADLMFILGLSEGPLPHSPNLAFENTTRLLKVGAFRFIRHPMYMSVILLAWGVAMKAPGIPSLALAFLVTLFLFITGKVEERENIERFGEEYRQYMNGTRMFIPFLF